MANASWTPITGDFKVTSIVVYAATKRAGAWAFYNDQWTYYPPPSQLAVLWERLREWWEDRRSPTWLIRKSR